MSVTTYATVNGRLVQENRGGVVTRFVAYTLGSVIQTRDEVGNQTSSTTYWPFGEVRTQTGTNPSPWGFCGVWGYYKDTAARLYVRARVLRGDLSRWLTQVRSNELMLGESAYGYGLNRPISIKDSTGLHPQYCKIDSNCPSDIQKPVKDFCKKVRNPFNPDTRPKINACIQKTASKFGANCNGITSERVACMRRFCRGEGAIKCETCTGHFARYCAYTPGFTEPGGNWDYPHYPVVVICMNNVNQPGCSNFDGSPNGIFNVIHEIMHSCGIAHNVPPGNGDRQCNDIAACCFYQVLMLEGDGSKCWQNVRR